MLKVLRLTGISVVVAIGALAVLGFAISQIHQGVSHIF